MNDPRKTHEEIEWDKEIAAELARYLSQIAADICPICGEPIKHKEQIGRCVYAMPCGDRLYQGRLKEGKG